jgi:hypothetical protein
VRIARDHLQPCLPSYHPANPLHIMLNSRPRKLLENNSRTPCNLGFFQKCAPSADGVPSERGSFFLARYKLVPALARKGSEFLGACGVATILGGGEAMRRCTFVQKREKSQARGLAACLCVCTYCCNLIGNCIWSATDVSIEPLFVHLLVPR